MRKLYIPVLILGVAAIVMALRPNPEATFDVSALNGAWKAVEVHAELQDTTFTREEARPNILLFTDGHWAAIRIGGEGTRAELPEEPTDEQLLEAWRPLRASAGSFTVSGNTISAVTLIAKNPNAMGGDSWDSEFSVEGDELVRVFHNEESGNTWTVTYARMD